MVYICVTADLWSVVPVSCHIPHRAVRNWFVLFDSSVISQTHLDPLIGDVSPRTFRMLPRWMRVCRCWFSTQRDLKCYAEDVNSLLCSAFCSRSLMTHTTCHFTVFDDTTNQLERSRHTRFKGPYRCLVVSTCLNHLTNNHVHTAKAILSDYVSNTVIPLRGRSYYFNKMVTQGWFISSYR